jgi:hypothetical protein
MLWFFVFLSIVMQLFLFLMALFLFCLTALLKSCQLYNPTFLLNNQLILMIHDFDFDGTLHLNVPSNMLYSISIFNIFIDIKCSLLLSNIKT